tara:strand:+ start:1154 stop:2206 length:1053 start_codon:yes stop_codon:yes gene_type:complete
MSEAQQELEIDSPASAEDKFFGVKTTIGKKGEVSQQESDSEVSDVEYEIVDDRPPEDRRPPKSLSASEDEDDELSGYSEKVKKRINKLRYEQNEERRHREASERMRDEAVRVAQHLANKNKEYEALINRGEGALISQVKQKAQMTLENAKSKYKKAYEEGDTDNVVSAQEELIKAQSELTEAEKYEHNLPREDEWQPPPPAYQQQAPVAPAPQQQPIAPPAPSPESEAWANNNPWFMSQEHKAMTATAYGLHEEAVRDHGLRPNSDQYFQYVDNGMRSSYPDYGWQDESDTYGRSATVTANQPSSVVAPSARNNGAKPRKVQLTSTQVALAKRLGLTNEQYAKELIKGKF